MRTPLKLELNRQVPSWTRLNYPEYCVSWLIDYPSQTMKVVFQSSRALPLEFPAMAAKLIANQPKGSTTNWMQFGTIRFLTWASKESINQRGKYFHRTCNLSLRRRREEFRVFQPPVDSKSQGSHPNLTRRSLQRLRCLTNKHLWGLRVAALATFLVLTSRRARVRILYVSLSHRTCNTNNRLEIQVWR